jgi:hypothetical protein
MEKIESISPLDLLTKQQSDISQILAESFEILVNIIKEIMPAIEESKALTEEEVNQTNLIKQRQEELLSVVSDEFMQIKGKQDHALQEAQMNTLSLKQSLERTYAGIE